MAQSDALAASGLQRHGFNYIDMDSGWMAGFDAYGRPIPNTAIFPDIAALAAHVHANGQKLGIYWIPGVEQPAVDANSPILGHAVPTSRTSWCTPCAGQCVQLGPVSAL